MYYRFILIVIMIMINSVIAIHLGLSTAIAKILTKILSCSKCLTFWSSLCLLYMLGCNIVIAVLLSLIGAYISNWLALILIRFNQKYEKLWQRLNNK